MLAIDCALAVAATRQGRPLNTIVRHHVNDLEAPNAEEVNPLAAKMGRLTFYIIAVAFIVPAALYWHFSTGSRQYLVTACILAGSAHLAIALLGSDKVAAHFGFWAPWFLP